MQTKFLFGLLVFMTSTVYAGVIREVRVDTARMVPITLQMGQSTVLRFSEKPRKVVVGNQNYFKVEFIENDITIQPQGIATTNLFVYGEYNTYGFILNVCGSCRSDDLVKVSWKSDFVLKQQKPKESKIVVKSSSIILKSKSVTAKVTKVIEQPLGRMHILEIDLENKTDTPIPTGEIQFRLTRGGKSLKNVTIVFDRGQIKSHDVGRARIFIKLEKKSGFTLLMRHQRSEVKKIISRSLL
ncbi:MAG: pilus assembly protein N-terminal domain-containing protein [Halobacteriovoraceae bacterium]|nr:pilus assembly protein N-terminal domain-containing protein [Halobacteriovoraceae bacterium]MCB9093441.1 pilus assembly protein N-terminal domain-containing protein [Halobacteriovoraceae bacterium]